MRQLEAAQRDVERLSAENESLMEISNALAAEKRQALQKRDAEAREGMPNRTLQSLSTSTDLKLVTLSRSTDILS